MGSRGGCVPPAVVEGAGIRPAASVVGVLLLEIPILSSPPLNPLSGTGGGGRAELPAGVPRRLTSWLLGFGGGTGGGGVGVVYIAKSLVCIKAVEEVKAHTLA